MQGYRLARRRQKDRIVPPGVNYDRTVDIAIDSTGIKAYNRGIRQKWAVRRGWVKPHITCDTT